MELPSLQDRIDWEMIYHYLGFEFSLLYPHPHLPLVGDLAEVVCSDWATDRQKMIAGEVFASLQEYQKRPIKPGYVYLLKAGPYYKIGKSKKPSSRIKTIRLQMPFPVEIHCLILSWHAYYTEARLHGFCADMRCNGEWYELTDDFINMISGLPQIIDTEDGINKALAKEGAWFPELMELCYKLDKEYESERQHFTTWEEQFAALESLEDSDG